MKSEMRVLLVEDNPGDARMVEMWLEESTSFRYRVRKVDQLSEAQKAVDQNSFDVIILDLNLPDSRGIDTFDRMNRAAPKTAIIILTGLSENEMAVRAVQGGAQDYLVKGEIDTRTLARSLRYAVERKRAEEALGEANRKLQLMTGITRHDILNQLIVLRGNLELAKTSKDPNAVEKFEDNTIQAARNIEALIRFTKDYQEIGLKEPSWQNIRRIVNTLASNVIFAGLKLENLLPEIDVSTDPLLVRVFANMIDNTVRHGERATFIRFRSQVEDGTLQIIYEDDGVGIQSEEKKKIFERGYGKNSGFGLFFAREILAITLSTIEENGEWGKGARFEIRVPSGKYRMMESASSE